MNISRNGSQPSSQGPPGILHGHRARRFAIPEERTGTSPGAIVTFEPGARTAWHTHPHLTGGLRPAGPPTRSLAGTPSPRSARVGSLAALVRR